jgi:hypothetical protein
VDGWAARICDSARPTPCRSSRCKYSVSRRPPARNLFSNLTRSRSPSAGGRDPLYSIIWLAEGRCLYRHDRVRHEVRAPALIFSTPFQDLEILPDVAPYMGRRLRFHGDFYCIERHKAEVSCDGVIFDNVYAVPFIALDEQGHQQVA